MTDITRQPRLRSGTALRARLRPGAAALALAVFGLAGCETLTNAYRDVSGASRDDPGPDTKNQAALDAGSKQDFANLASVPNPPVRGLTEEQRKQLAEGLVADRNNAHYTAQRVASGDAAAVMPTQAPIPEDAAATSGALPDSAATAPSPPVPDASISKVLPDASGSPPAQTAADAAPPTQPADIPAPELSSGSELAGGGELLSSTSGSSAANAGQIGKKKHRHHGNASDESASSAPQPRENPVPQTEEEPPAAPALPPTPNAAPSGGEAGDQLAGGGELMQHDVQIANAPQPAAIPAAPDLTANPAVSAGAATAPASKRGTSQVFEVEFPRGSNDVSAPALASLDGVPDLHNQHGGLVRVISHAEIPNGGNDPAAAALTSYQTALARSQAVKQVLVARGIPAQQVIAEVSTKESASDRVDVVVEY